MAIVNEARAVLTAEDRASQVLAAVARNFDRLNKAADRLDKSPAREPRVMQEAERRASRMAQITAGMGMAARNAMGPVAGLLSIYGVGRTMTAANRAFAENERAMTRVAVTADATSEAQRYAFRQLQDLSSQTAMPVDKVREGLESLVAAGRSLPEAMEFLPSVARTAQASGATVNDIAKSADAVGSAFKIAGGDMQHAFDIMATGGKLGQFELKDMARYLPSLAPAAAAIGMSGKKGLTDLVAMLQVLRKGSGTAEEAAGSMNNILQKMSSEETTKRYKKMGVDLDDMFKKGKASGKDMISVFMEATQLATKGDLGKLPNLISDMEFARGVRAMMMYRGELGKIRSQIDATANGAVGRDLERVLANSQASMDRAKVAAERLSVALGTRLGPAFKAVTDKATEAMNAVSGALEPSKSDRELAAEIGAPDRLTPAEKSIQQAERMQEVMRKANDRNSEYYDMRDGGFASGLTRFSPQRHAILRNKSKRTKAEDKELALLDRREQKMREASDAIERNRPSREALERFRASERDFAAEYEKSGRSGPVYQGIEADNRLQQRARDAEAGIQIDDLLRGRGEAGDAFRQAFANYVRSERMRFLSRKNSPTMDDGSPLPQSFDPTLGRQSDSARTDMMRAAEQILKQSGQTPTQAQIEQLYGQLADAAKRLSEKAGISPGVDPTKVPGQAEALANALAGANITAKTDLDVTSEVKVKIEPTPDFWAKIDARIETKSKAVGGISLPGKEMPKSYGGGGGGGGAQ